MKNIIKIKEIENNIIHLEKNVIICLAKMAKNINYSAMGVNTILGFESCNLVYSDYMTQLKNERTKLFNRKQYCKRFTNKRYLKVK